GPQHQSSLQAERRTGRPQRWYRHRGAAPDRAGRGSHLRLRQGLSGIFFGGRRLPLRRLRAQEGGQAPEKAASGAEAELAFCALRPDKARLLALVPNIGRELPASSHLLPHHDVFSSDFLWRLLLGLQAERADLARRRRPQPFDIEGRDFRIADLLRQTFPHRADRSPAFAQCGARRKCGRISGVKRGDTIEIAFIEKRDPFGVDRLDVGFLGDGWRDQAYQKSSHQYDVAHDQLRSVYPMLALFQARAASGHIATLPPGRIVNARRLMIAPSGWDITGYHTAGT